MFLDTIFIAHLGILFNLSGLFCIRWHWRCCVPKPGLTEALWCKRLRNFGMCYWNFETFTVIIIEVCFILFENHSPSRLSMRLLHKYRIWDGTKSFMCANSTTHSQIFPKANIRKQVCNIISLGGDGGQVGTSKYT